MHSALNAKLDRIIMNDSSLILQEMMKTSYMISLSTSWNPDVFCYLMILLGLKGRSFCASRLSRSWSPNDTRIPVMAPATAKPTAAVGITMARIKITSACKVSNIDYSPSSSERLESIAIAANSSINAQVIANENRPTLVKVLRTQMMKNCIDVR